MAKARNSYRILHILRAPVGGLFRHVCDLARAQAGAGHQVGIMCDSRTGGERAARALAQLEPDCALGITRLPVGRLPGLADAAAIGAVSRIARRTGANVLHGHGAKGGAYARLAGGSAAKRFYTPHGGSLHYSRATPAGFIYLALEKCLLSRTDGLIFESDYGRRAFAARVAAPRCPVRVIHNGLRADEFKPVRRRKDAADLLFIGELRELKGVATLLHALALLARRGEHAELIIVGDGPGREAFLALTHELGLDGQVRFESAMPARDAFSRARVTVVPSHAESLPYIVLEAAAAGVPLVATRAGGIPEIFGPDSDALVPPDDPAALAGALSAALARRDAKRTSRIRTRVKTHFSLEAMSAAVLDFYGAHGK